MEDNGDDVCYSTVSIKSGKPRPEGSNEEAAVYSEVKKNTAVPAEAGGAEEKTAALRRSGLLMVCLGILCVLLAASVAVIIHLSLQMKQQEKNIRNLARETEQLTEERKVMENRTEELSRQRDDLNATLGFIQQFDNFPVTDFCPDKKCEPCPRGWITFRGKCYLFHDSNSLETWKQSRQICLGKHADLVVINDLKEQEFVRNHTKYYHSEYHGYWLGLHQTNNTWIWVDGREDSLGFWIKGVFGTPGPNALLIPGRNLTESWNKGDDVFKLKFICDHKALIWSH